MHVYAKMWAKNTDVGSGTQVCAVRSAVDIHPVHHKANVFVISDQMRLSRLVISWSHSASKSAAFQENKDALCDNASRLIFFVVCSYYNSFYTHEAHYTGVKEVA